jgi:AcrR family transcriptional regulator
MNQARVGIRERIVDAAVHLFSRQGFSGTSTREIARLADVNEASLFRHFPSKQELFWVALQSRLERLRFSKELQNGLSRRDKPERVLPLIIELLVQIATYETELIRLLEIGLLELRPGAERIYRQQVAPIFLAISDYLEGCIKCGALRGLDPTVTTIALSSTILAHQGLYGLFTGTGLPYANNEEAVSAYSKFWLIVLRPETKVDPPVSAMRPVF